jgi:hypothetical protein
MKGFINYYCKVLCVFVVVMSVSAFKAKALITVTLADNGTQVAAGNIIAGTTNNILYQITLTTTGATASDPKLNSLQFLSGGTYASADITNLKCRYSTNSTLDAGDATLSTYSGPPAAGLLTFPSFTSQLLPNATVYIFITADIAAAATVGHTIYVSSFGTGNMTLSLSPTMSGSSTTPSGTQTIVFPSITLANNGTQVAAANVAQGATNHVLHKISLSVSSSDATLTGIQCVTAGASYVSTDITNLKVRYSTDATLDAGDATLSTFTTPGTAGTKVFPSFTSQIISSGTTGYIFITADVAVGAVAGHSINVNAIGTGDLTFSIGNKSGSSSAGGSQTIATPGITLADNSQVTAANVPQGTSTHVLNRISLTVGTASATLSGMQCVTAGTYISSDIINLKVIYSSNSTLDAGDATLSTYSTPGAAGTKIFPSFTSQVIPVGTGYIFITADIFPGASAGRTISVNAIGTGDVTFISGSKSGTPTAGGTQTFSGLSYSNIYEVNSTADAGLGTLRQAIINANVSAGRDYIYFNLGAGGPYTISLNTSTVYGINSYDIGLTTTDNSGVTIDGWTNVGNYGTPNSVSVASSTTSTPMNPNYKVILTTNNSFNTILHLNSNNNIVKGLVFTNWGDNPTDLRDVGILISGSNNQILGCFIGTNAAGTAIGGSYEGVGIFIWSTNNSIGDGTASGANLISGGTFDGAIQIEWDSPEAFVIGTGNSGNTIRGNMIGLQKDGTNKIAGGSVSGINLGGGEYKSVTGTEIGGITAGQGNVISGNVTGIRLSTLASGNNIIGNIIGPCADGVSYVTGNTQLTGISVEGPSNTIGGNSSSHRNIISGNETYGIKISGGSASSNTINGNYIGPSSSLTNFRISSTATTNGNEKEGNELLGLSNQDYGIYLSGSSANNFIGGSGAGEANTIAYNTFDGIYITGAGSNNNLITHNSIYSNNAAGKPINLNYLGTPGNNGKAVPVIATASTSLITGTSGVSNTIEIFKNTTGSPYDAVTYVGTTTADGSGNWSKVVSLSNGDYVIANATDGSNNTSEFNNTVFGPLPVELTSFSLDCNDDNSITCSWSTATESNNDHFTVERTYVSLNDWKALGTVKGAGTTSSVQRYSFTDTEPLPGTSYYRITQTDFNGQSESFSPLAVNCSDRSGFTVNINPNIIEDGNIMVSIQKPADENILVVLTNIFGQELYSLVIMENDNNFLQSIPIGKNIPSGVYYITASSNNKYISKKLVVR